MLDFNEIFPGRINAANNLGEENTVFKLSHRLDDFQSLISLASKAGYKTMILAGHSTWLKQFYKEFLLKESDMKTKSGKTEWFLKNHKLGNASVVQFTMISSDSKEWKIEPGSTNLIFGRIRHVPLTTQIPDTENHN